MLNEALQKPPLTVVPGHDVFAKAFQFQALSQDLPELRQLWTHKPRNRVLTLGIKHVDEYMNFLRKRFHPALSITVSSKLFLHLYFTVSW